MSAQDEKRRWRRHLRERLRALSSEEVHARSQVITERVRTEWCRERPGVVGLFAAMPQEPDLAPLRDEAGVKVYPRICGDELTWWSVEGAAGLEAGEFGIQEPQMRAGCQIEPEALDWILVPGLGFGRDGSRLGRGRGYYDRVLKRVRGRVIGIAFEIQVEDRLPREEWDRSVAELVTEAGWRRIEPPVDGLNPEL